MTSDSKNTTNIFKKILRQMGFNLFEYPKLSFFEIFELLDEYLEKNSTTTNKNRLNEIEIQDYIDKIKLEKLNKGEVKSQN